MFMKGIEMKKMNPINEFDKQFLLPDNLVLKMIWCPAGTFLMGSPAAEQGRCSDELMHPVTLTRGFWIGQYAVTRGQYRTVIGNGSVGKGIKNLPMIRFPMRRRWSSAASYVSNCQSAGYF